MDKEKPKIFLSYAHEDIGMAKRIYQDLKRHGLDIWFNNESLLVGQNWKFEINKAIKESKYFLAVLSKESIDSIGYVQKELKTALEMLDLHPKTKSYILPIRIEDCEPIEERLSDLHWINVFPKSEYQNGLKKILQVVRPEKFLLRSKSMKLSNKEVHNMIRKHDFFDIKQNLLSKGFPHKYKEINLNGNKVIFDEVLCLMWQKSGSSRPLNFEEVEEWMTKLNQENFAGFNDWRLPTLEEAMSLVEPKKMNGLHINSIFDNFQAWIWTADQIKDLIKANPAWAVDFSDGSCCWGVIYGYCVRAVRSWQTDK